MDKPKKPGIYRCKLKAEEVAKYVLCIRRPPDWSKIGYEYEYVREDGYYKLCMSPMVGEYEPLEVKDAVLRRGPKNAVLPDVRDASDVQVSELGWVGLTRGCTSEEPA